SLRQSAKELPAQSDATIPATPCRRATVLVAAGAGLLALACGGWVAALDRLIVQLSPGSIYIGCAEVMGLCGGLSIGAFLTGRSKDLGDAGKLLITVGLALWGVGLLAAYPLLIDLSLWLNAR